jgi:N-acetylglucosaminyl-diphospho-decaprenol L-rhamnosyltransferase
MKLLIVIVNYRTAGLTSACLQSLVGELDTLRDAHVIVMDNASGDDSVTRITRAVTDLGLSERVMVMPLARNGGFAFGNNEAIRHAQAHLEPFEYVLLLNPDTIARPGAVEKLVEFMDSHPRVGIGGSRLEDPDGTSQRSAFRFHTIASEFEGGLQLGIVSKLLARSVVAPPCPTEACRTDWVAGASMIVRAKVLHDVGLLDEQYFMYFEEVDFCRRATRAGWPTWYVPESRVVHLVGQASGVTDPHQQRKRRPGYWFESRRRYFVKNYGRAYASLADAAWAGGYVLWRLRRRLQRKPDNDPSYLLRDFLRHSVFARGFHHRHSEGTPEESIRERASRVSDGPFAEYRSG